MTSKIISASVLTFTLTALIACNSGTPATDDAAQTYIAVTPDILVSATTDFESPSHTVDATFVPNLVSGWATQLILIDEAGALSRTQMDRPHPKTFEDGPYVSAQGFGRKMQPGTLLALKDDGSVQAFIEVSDAGDFDRIPVSLPDLKITRFCKARDLTASRLTVETKKGDLVTLDISVEKNTQVTLTTSSDPIAESCTQDKINLMSKESGALFSNPTGPHLILERSGKKTIIGVQDGLSIRGIDDPDILLLTEKNLGGAFSNGALVVTDTQSNRIVLIAQDYLVDEIKTR